MQSQEQPTEHYWVYGYVTPPKKKTHNTIRLCIRSKSTIGMAFASHATNLGLIPGIL